MVIGQHVAALAALAIPLVAGCMAGSAGSTPSTTPSTAPIATRPTFPVPSGVTPVPTPVAPAPTRQLSATSHPVRVSSPAQAAALVFASDPRFGSVGEDGTGRVGQSSSYQASENVDGYSVSITIGSGDCQSSCTNRHTWNYSVSRAAEIQLISEQGDKLEVPIEQGTNDPAEVTVRLRAGPVCPVERNPPDPSCAARPVPGVEVVVHDPSGAEVGRASSGDDGNVSFTVPGGAYYVEPAVAPDVLRQAQAQAFSVPGGHSATVTIEYDTGIR